MIFQFSCPYPSPQNRKEERIIYTINNIIHTLLTRATLLPHFWHHALHMTTYLLNTLSNKKLELKFSIKKICHTLTLKSSVVFVAILFHLPLKINLLSCSTPCAFFLHYPSNQRGYKCYGLPSHKIIISRHATFDENTFPFSTLNDPQISKCEFLDTSNTPFRNSYSTYSHQNTTTTNQHLLLKIWPHQPQLPHP